MGERDEVTRDEPRALVNQLVEGVLAVGARFAPVNRTGLVINFLSVERDVFAVALHRQLLQVGRESFQILLVRQNRDGVRAEKIGVPNRQETHQHRQIFFERRGAEMFVHLVKSLEHCAEVFRPDGEHGRKADGRIHGVTSADPVPKAEHVRRINAERGNFFGIGRDGDEMFRHGFRISAESFKQPVRARSAHWSSSPAW